MIRTELIAASGANGDTGALRELTEAITWSDLSTGHDPFAHPAETIRVALGMSYFRILGARRGSDDREDDNLPALAPDDLAAVAGTGSAVAYFLSSRDGSSTVAVGVEDPNAERLATAVQARLGGPAPARFEPSEDVSRCTSWACLLGTPSVEWTASPPPALADRLLDAARNDDVCILVVATPEPVDHAREQLEIVRTTSEDIERVHLQLGQQGNINRSAVRARELLDRVSHHLEEGVAGRLWRVSILVGAPTAESARFVAGLMSGAFSPGGEPAPLVPVRAFGCSEDSRGLSVHTNLLTPEQLSSLCSLPSRDRDGFRRTWEADFDVDHPVGGGGVDLGAVLDRGLVGRGRVTLEREALTRHTLIAGHTGAGKTTTVQKMLADLSGAGVPFLVIEPAKREYADLGAQVPDLRIFALDAPGACGRVPLLLNPFSFPEGFPLHTHIDYLKTAFVSSFGLIPPAPYLLESAIYEAYRRRGWDLAQGRHRNGHDPLAFPILRDLMAAADDIVSRAGYDPDVTRNLRSALRTRIGNLMIGPKGTCLNTYWILPDSELWERSAVVELAGLGSDEEKAFLMGLLLTRLYEVRETSRSNPSEGLRHLLVVEEAHRLLRRVPERSTEEGNMAHQAVQTFVNLLAELRAYGEGVLCVEQIPTKLSSEVVKLAGTKIVHRLLPEDDRDVLGGAMALSQDQRRALVNLATGEAVCHSEGMDGAVRVRVEPARLRDVEATPDSTNERTALVVQRELGRAPYAGLLEEKDVVAAADGVVALAMSAGDAEVATGELGRLIDRRLASQGGGKGLTVEQHEARLYALEDAILRRVIANGLDAECYEKCRHPLATGGLAQASSQLVDAVGRASGMHDGHEGCQDPCRWRYEGQLLARDPGFEADLVEIIQGANGNHVVTALERVCERNLRVTSLGRDPGLARCAVVQLLQRWDLSRRATAEILDYVGCQVRESRDKGGIDE